MLPGPVPSGPFLTSTMTIMTTFSTSTLMTVPTTGAMSLGDPMMVHHRCDATTVPQPTLAARSLVPTPWKLDPIGFPTEAPIFITVTLPTSLPTHGPDARGVGEQLFTIELGPDDRRVVTQAQKLALKADGKSFLDITDFVESSSLARPLLLEDAVYTYPSSMQHRDEVESLLGRLRKENIESNIKPFTGFYNRFYNSDMGKNASEWLFAKVQDVVSESGVRNVKVVPFDHSWEQHSIIATIPGSSKKTIVIGAHLDSINSADTWQAFGKHEAPGADDNASGVMTILEALRVLLSDPKVAAGELSCTVEFHWYAAEEVGLMGSFDIFKAYASQGRHVYAMLNQDMIAYTSPAISGLQEPHIGVVTDNVNQNLTEFVKSVIDTYSDLDWKETKCGYACSDHASANRTHFPSALISESINPRSNPHYHTEHDCVQDLNFDHALEFAKVAVGFAYELGSSDE